MTIVVLAVLGLCFGSFVNALVFRLHVQSKNRAKSKEQRAKYSITQGRSMCPNCKHELAPKDLVPVLSWLWLRGKCRYCKKPISWQYPLLELSTAALFVVSFLSWPAQIHDLSSIIEFGFWLAFLIGFMALIVYDIRYMLLPNKIVFTLIFLAVFSILLKSILTTNHQPLTTSFFGALIGGGLFYLLFQLSNGAWIGGGDVKLGFLLGLIVGGPLPAVLMLFLASLGGTLYSLPLIATKKANRKTRIPFGPFLICAAILTQLFDEQLINFYLNNFLR